MHAGPDISVIRRRYRDAYGIALTPGFSDFMHCGAHAGVGSALGYRRAGEEPLFLEAYLDDPIETAVSSAFGKSVCRDRIVEIGNFAADNAIAMVELWGKAANDLASDCEIAVATLTAPLRRMFARIGVPLVVLAPARRDRLQAGAQDWGSYYETDPRVCAGQISLGQEAISAFLSRRRGRAAACA